MNHKPIKVFYILSASLLLLLISQPRPSLSALVGQSGEVAQDLAGSAQEQLADSSNVNGGG
jgi:hypothetical protein